MRGDVNHFPNMEPLVVRILVEARRHQQRRFAAGERGKLRGLRMIPCSGVRARQGRIVENEEWQT